MTKEIAARRRAGSGLRANVELTGSEEAAKCKAAQAMLRRPRGACCSRIREVDRCRARATINRRDPDPLRETATR